MTNGTAASLSFKHLVVLLRSDPVAVLEHSTTVLDLVGSRLLVEVLNLNSTLLAPGLVSLVVVVEAELGDV